MKNHNCCHSDRPSENEGAEESLAFVYFKGKGSLDFARDDNNVFFKSLTIISVLILTLVFTASCSKSGGGDTPTPTPLGKSLTLKPYGSCTELESEIKATLIGEMERNMDNLRYNCRFDDFVGGGDQPMPLVSPDVSTESAARSTGTNLQEPGVDEADLIKTDGATAYAIVGNKVIVSRIWPLKEFKELSTITPKLAPQGLYLADGKLIVLSSTPIFIPMEMACAPSSSGAEGCAIPDAREVSTVEVYDVSDPAQPALIKQMEISGTLMSSRRIDSRLYLVMSDEGVVYPTLNYDLGIPYENLPLCSDSKEPTPTEEMLSAIEKLKNENREKINALTLAELTPNIGDGKELGCSDIMRSESAAGTTIIKLVSDTYADSASAPSTTAILSNGGAAYASKQALYIASPTARYGWWQFDGYDEKDTTVIHRMSLNGTKPVYTGSAEVEGHLLDNGFAGSRYSSGFSMAQFAMSERNGYLRIATTTTDTSSDETVQYNNVAVYNATDENFGLMSALGGLAKGEKIHAIRFIGDKAYMVTFKKTDPLFVIDLADSRNPVLEGELKVPGFSTYLHPFDDGHLIGLGFAADDTGDFAWTQGLKIALFDVSDPKNPQEVGSREIGSRGSYSSAVEEHHAFTLDTTRGLIALPVDISEGGSGGSDFGTSSFSGVMILSADLSGSFETKGTIVIEKHENGDTAWWSYYASQGVLRTAIVGDDKDTGIVTLTTAGVQLNRMDDQMTLMGQLY